jgi:AcrR family transcriptional regulator
MDTKRRGRARPMPVEDRQAMIASAAIPLFIERGASLTTREIADELGIAEGTIFRAFGDKDALVRSVIDAFFEEENQRLTSALEAPGLGVAEKMRVLIRESHTRAKGVFAMLSLLDHAEAREYMKNRREHPFEEAIAAAFSDERVEFNLPKDRLSTVLRLLIIAASAPRLGGAAALTDDELVTFALHGLIGQPPSESVTGDSSRKD